VRFSERLVLRCSKLGAAMQHGEFITDATAECGAYRKKGAWWIAATVASDLAVGGT
jgi:hypothetical protein